MTWYDDNNEFAPWEVNEIIDDVNENIKKRNEEKIKIKLDEASKREAITALVASAFTHYKKMLIGNINTAHLVPTPTESREAYLNDVFINHFVDTVVAGVIQISKM